MIPKKIYLAREYFTGLQRVGWRKKKLSCTHVLIPFRSTILQYFFWLCCYVAEATVHKGRLLLRIPIFLRQFYLHSCWRRAARRNSRSFHLAAWLVSCW